MAATVTSLPLALVYLIVFALEGFGGGAYDADYLQGGVPTWALHVEADLERGSRVIRIDAIETPSVSPANATEEARVVRVEQSELVAGTFLVYLEPGGLPAVVSLAPLLSQLALTRIPNDLTIELPDAGDLAAGAELSLGSTLHILRRGEAILLSAPDSGIVLLIHHP